MYYLTLGVSLRSVSVIRCRPDCGPHFYSAHYRYNSDDRIWRTAFLTAVPSGLPRDRSVEQTSGGLPTGRPCLRTGTPSHGTTRPRPSSGEFALVRWAAIGWVPCRTSPLFWGPFPRGIRRTRKFCHRWILQRQSIGSDSLKGWRSMCLEEETRWARVLLTYSLQSSKRIFS